MRLERYEDAARAYAQALKLLGEDPGRRSGYGEALTAAAGGVVTDKAREAFAKALAGDPRQPQARFYLALAAEQDGKKDDAIRAYEALVADAAPDAPWLVAVQARLAALKGEPQSAAAEGPSLGSPEQKAMIEGMVNRLAGRLATNGGSVDEWARLIRAYAVLHQAGKAKAALADARKALAPDANAVAEPRRARARPRPRRRQLTRKSRRLALIAAALAVIGCAVGLGLYAMKDSLALFLTPAEMAGKALAPGTRLRIGGLVEGGRSRGPMTA